MINERKARTLLISINLVNDHIHNSQKLIPTFTYRYVYKFSTEVGIKRSQIPKMAKIYDRDKVTNQQRDFNNRSTL